MTELTSPGCSQIDGEGLSPAARAALAALRAEEGPPAAVEERVWSRLEAATGDEVSERTGRRRGAWVFVGLAIAAGVVLAIAGVQRSAVPVARETAAPEAQYGGETGASQVARAGKAGAGEAVVKEEAGAVNVPGVSAMGVTGVPEAGPEEARVGGAGVAKGTGPEGQVAEDRSERTGRRRGADEKDEAAKDATVKDAAVKGEGEAKAGPGPALAREAALLQQAQAALAGERTAEALAHLGTYDREFGADGVLRPEHDGLRAVALCAAGRRSEGAAAAAAFLKKHAGSVQAERVRGACGATE